MRATPRSVPGCAVSESGTAGCRSPTSPRGRRMGKSATFGLLGPFELRVGGDEIPVRSARHRVLLATLSLRHGQHVSFEELADAVWGDDQQDQPNHPDQPKYPENPRRAIQIIVTRVRALLVEHGSLPLIVTSPDGYRLDVPPDSVDVGRFA